MQQASGRSLTQSEYARSRPHALLAPVISARSLDVTTFRKHSANTPGLRSTPVAVHLSLGNVCTSHLNLAIVGQQPQQPYCYRIRIPYACSTSKLHLGNSSKRQALHQVLHHRCRPTSTMVETESLRPRPSMSKAVDRRQNLNGLRHMRPFAQSNHFTSFWPKSTIQSLHTKQPSLARTLMLTIPMSELAPPGTTPTPPVRPPAGASAAAGAATGDWSDVAMERADGNPDREVVDPADEELGDQDE
ncbi:hypothetical protein PHYSODRAFT_320805 [Phytophthora sojae]|uniref:Uncharacterized protein n=1 Tax=Phytophthora sojae (strain P6497) TaxID=1094619 RepID=G4YEU0_PHYSP|nr:hypothetical protein PHYSODRAFT_320805 [Phytophthora sojae]EGZ26934.1 hypothetical protein PHYSODRAFT_320805 [Phytophthora sojae]|eukprot:XP_009514209.1 hypothetical protein PHYSODRAFT_320805 [Phytophthora sojae]